MRPFNSQWTSNRPGIIQGTDIWNWNSRRVYGAGAGSFSRRIFTSNQAPGGKPPNTTKEMPYSRIAALLVCPEKS
jgi:hypothetical protein